MKPAFDTLFTSETAAEVMEPKWTITLPNGMQISPNIVHAAILVFFIFLAILIIARFRRMYVSKSLKESAGMVGFGFFVALFLEGLFILGGRTLFTEILGWENAPKPISLALDAGRDRLVSVLGVTDSVPESSADNTKKGEEEEILELINNLPDDKKEELFINFCSPK